MPYPAGFGRPSVFFPANVTVATDRGGRLSQQDRWLIQKVQLNRTTPHSRGLLFAVMDGHGEFGDQLAEIIRVRLPKLFSQYLQQNDGDPIETWKQTIERLHLEVNTKEICWHAGSTLAGVYVPEPATQAFVAILGDSSVVIRNNEGNIWVSPEHNVSTNPEDVKKILTDCQKKQIEVKADDGYLVHTDVGYMIQLTRALGDQLMSDCGLIRQPDVMQVPLDADSWILVASDGLRFQPEPTLVGWASYWQSAIEQEGYDAAALVNDSVTQFKADNVTAILWRAPTS